MIIRSSSSFSGAEKGLDQVVILLGDLVATTIDLVIGDLGMAVVATMELIIGDLCVVFVALEHLIGDLGVSLASGALGDGALAIGDDGAHDA